MSDVYNILGTYFDVVKYLFLQRSAAIFALVDRQLNNQEESQRTVFASTSAQRSRFDTDHIFGQRKLVTPKTPLLPTPLRTWQSAYLVLFIIFFVDNPVQTNIFGRVLVRSLRITKWCREKMLGR